MELGEKLYQARVEAGLSQRQLCGEVITRNMLSQIEHGTAKPSMGTLQYLAGRLGKPVSYFLEEDAVVSPNQQTMTLARRAWQEGDFPRARLLLENYKGPDETFDLEYAYLRTVTTLAAAQTAFAAGKDRYARELLMDARQSRFPGLERQRLLLLGQTDTPLEQICSQLPGLDPELLLRARAAAQDQNWQRCLALVQAMEVPDALLKGRALLELGRYEEALAVLSGAGETRQTLPLLERCCRELGDYKGAYEYACKQKQQSLTTER